MSATSPPPAELPELRNARVLVIDDEPALCAVVRRLPRGRQEVVGGRVPIDQAAETG